MTRLKSGFFLFLLIFIFSCQKKGEIIVDPTPYDSRIFLESSSHVIPLNEYGKAILLSRSQYGDDYSNQSEFYINDERLDGNVFIPSEVGEFKAKAVYKDIISKEITILVEEPLNKKLLIEYYTSRTCGWCPWIGKRVDSLHNDRNLIGYSIHGEDHLQIEGTGALQEYQKVYNRPSIRLNRLKIKHYAAPIEIQPLQDSIYYQLSSQAKAEIAINSVVNQHEVAAEIFGKFHHFYGDSLFLTFLLVEDNIVILNQSNYFNGHSDPNNPFINLPNPIPEYTAHNVVRKFITASTGELLTIEISNSKLPVSLGKFQFEIDDGIDIENASLIAILHEKREDVEISSVLNSQIVKLGENISFDE